MAAALVLLTAGTTIALRPAWANFLGTTSNTANSFTAAASFPTYPTEVVANGAWAYYRGEESASSAATATATDSSTNGRHGTYNGYTNGPQLYWKLDEGTGSTVIDSSGAANPGTPTNSPTTTTGKVDSALSFNGTTQYVDGTRAAVNTTRSFSVAAWAKLSGKGQNRTVIGQDGSSVSGFFLQYDNTFQRWSFAMRGSDATASTVARSTGTVDPNTGQWYHLIGVYDSAAVGAELKLYIDGTAQTAAAYTPWASTSTGALTVGRGKWNGAVADRFAGDIDDVRVFQRALTANEARSLGSGGSATGAGMPLLDWELSEGIGGSTTDRGTSGYNGNVVSGAWTTSGHDGNAFTFTSTVTNGNRIVGATATPAINTTISYTVSAWVKLSSDTGDDETAVSQDGTTTSNFELGFDDSSNTFTFTTYGDNTGAPVYQATGTTPTMGTWYHLVGVYDNSAANIKLYVNGTQQGAAVAFATPWASSAGGKFAVGRGFSGGGQNNFFDGTIDTVKAWQRALSATEITDLYNGNAYTEADMTAGIPGALQGAQQGLTATTAIAYAGMNNGYYGTSVNNPTTFTLECWFRTTSTTGGVIMSFGDQKTGSSTNRDRYIYLDSGNKISFGVNPGGTQKILRSTSTYNDGAWHYVAASLGAAGQKLYLDGALITSDATVTTAQNFTGYWRFGGDLISGWTNNPTGTSTFFTGTIDEVAIYQTQLSNQQIAWNYYANH